MRRLAVVVVLAALASSCESPLAPDAVEHRRPRAHPQGQNPTPPPFESTHPHNGEFWSPDDGCGPRTCPTPQAPHPHDLPTAPLGIIHEPRR